MMTGIEYREERRRRGLTQAGLALLVGVHKVTITKRETGVTPITVEAEIALRSLPLKPKTQARVAS